ncbi:MAG: queuosine salvage family protein [Patescibacteria group bacterium]
MNLEITTADPFNILASTKRVMENANFVSLDLEAVKTKAPLIAEYLKANAEFPDHGHNLSGDFNTDAQLVFFESMMGFCFWAMPGEPKWSVALESGEKVDGWYGVCAAFKRAFDEGVPVADAKFLESVAEKQVKHIFRSATKAEIPLLQRRVAILNKNAAMLKKAFGGQAVNLIDAAERDAVKLFKLLLDFFPSYKDVTVYKEREVVFLKIAHLLALDYEYRLPHKQRPFLKNFDKLCVFADYKLPQLLRMDGILKYNDQLSAVVDSYKIIPVGTPEEVEIRSGAVWGVELIRQQIPEFTTVQIGHAIWLASQDQALQSKIKPYHRTLTTFY